MKLTMRFLFLWIILNTLIVASAPNWNGKWHVNWISGIFILQLEQHGSDVNGTYEPSHGTLQGKIKDNVLTAVTNNESGIKNKITLTLSESPFKTGDRIRIGSDVGVITNVGIWSTKIRTTQDTILTVPNNKITQEMIDNYSEREAMRIDTNFYFALETPKDALDKLDTEISTFLREHEEVDNKKIILTGVNDFTKRGINFAVSFFVNATTEMQYSDIRHRIMTDLGQIVRDSGIEMVMINIEEAEK